MGPEPRGRSEGVGDKVKGENPLISYICAAFKVTPGIWGKKQNPAVQLVKRLALKCLQPPRTVVHKDTSQRPGCPTMQDFRHVRLTHAHISLYPQGQIDHCVLMGACGGGSLRANG